MPCAACSPGPGEPEHRSRARRRSADQAARPRSARCAPASPSTIAPPHFDPPRINTTQTTPLRPARRHDRKNGPLMTVEGAETPSRPVAAFAQCARRSRQGRRRQDGAVSGAQSSPPLAHRRASCCSKVCPAVAKNPARSHLFFVSFFFFGRARSAPHSTCARRACRSPPTSCRANVTRLGRLRREGGRLRVSARARVHEHPARRRDQPQRPPKTQSALLEAMRSARVTVDGETQPCCLHTQFPRPAYA